MISSKQRAGAARFALIVVLAITAAACGLAERPALVRQTFLLQTPPPRAPAQGKPRAVALKVDRLNVAAPFRGNSLVYRQSDLRYVSDFYAEYFVAPAPVLTDSTVSWLAAAGVFRDVLPPDASGEGDLVLEGFVGELYGDFRDAAQPQAVVTVKFFLTDNRGGSVQTGVPFWQHEYTQRVAIKERSGEALVAGLGTAWSAILTDLARDLAAAKLPK